MMRRVSNPPRRRVAVALAAALLLLASTGVAAAEVAQRGHLRIHFDGDLTPHALPRHGDVAVRVAVGARIASTDGSLPPQLRRISIEINRNGHFDPTGLPVCRVSDIQPASTAAALAGCRGSLVGEGHFSAQVALGAQAPFPAEGRLLAFNGRSHGRPAILAHVYGTRPVPTSYTLVFAISPAKGTFGTVLDASLAGATGQWGYVTGISISLGRSFTWRGARHSYLSAACPAPPGFRTASFPFARATFSFTAGRPLSTTAIRTCRARG
jgi:hypothetical protein